MRANKRKRAFIAFRIMKGVPVLADRLTVHDSHLFAFEASLLNIVGEARSKFLPGSGQKSHDRAFWQPQNLTDLAVTKLANSSQQQDTSLILGQVEDSTAHAIVKAVVDDGRYIRKSQKIVRRFLGLWFVDGNFRIKLNGSPNVCAIGIQNFESDIPENPGTKTCAQLELRKVSIRSQQRCLKHIRRVIGTAQAPATEHLQLAVNRLQEFRKSFSLDVITG